MSIALVFGLLVAAFAVLVVVPLALLFGLALPLIIVVLVLGGLVAGAFGIGLLLLSPLLVPVVLMWCLWRRSPAPVPGAQGSTGGAAAARIDA